MDLQHQFSILSRSQKIAEGMSMRFIVSYVDVEENLLKLWIQPDPSMVQNLVTIMQSLRSRIEKSEGFMHQCQLTLNGFYCVKPTDSECWYRARVIKHAPNDSIFVIVHFIDYGHTGVIRVTNVKPFDEKLYSIPPQAVKCVMAEVASATGEAWHKEAAEYIRKILSQNEVTGNVVSKYLDIPYVRVFINGISLAHHLIEKGIGIPLTSGIKPQTTQMVIYNGETYRGLPLDINKDYFVYVSHIESPQKFYIQLAYNEHELNSLMEKISIHAVEQGFYPLEEILPGSPCISQFSEDDNFYRAVVTKVTPPTCQITYIDYGNSENKSHFELKTIPQKFLAVPAQAKECKLPSNVVIDTDTFRLLVEDKLLSCHINEQQSSYVVTLHHDGKNIFQQNEHSLISVYSQPLITQPYTYKSLDLHLNSTHKVFVTYIHSPVQFYCQLSQNTLHIKNIMTSIATFCEMSNPEINSIFLNECFPGKPLCCKYSVDQQWYRAIVLDSIQNASIPVQFVDYGNEEITYVSALKKINPELLEWPIQAIKCCLINFEVFPLNILTSDSIINEMEKLVLNEELVVKLEDKRNDIYLVSLYNTSSNSPVCINTKLQEIIQVSYLQSMNKQLQNNINVNNVMCQNSMDNCVSISNDSVPDDRLYPVIPTGALEEVVITDASSPSSFFCQLQREAFELDTLMDELTEYYNGLCDDNERIDNFIVGMLCVARYSEDDNWYRAKIIDVLKSGIVEIFFVDYGNKEKTEKTNVKKISSEFLNVSFKAIECSLFNVDAENIQSEIIKNFQTLVLNNTFTAIFKGIELGVYKVELLDSEENNINEKFQALSINNFAVTNIGMNSAEEWNENKNSTNLNEWVKNDKYKDNKWEESEKVNSETNYYNSWNEEETERNSSKFLSSKLCSSDWKKSKTEGNKERKYSKYDKSNDFESDSDEKRNYNSQIKQNWNINEQKSAQGKSKNKPIDHWQYGDHFVPGDESDANLYSKKQSKNEKLVKSVEADHGYYPENLIDFKSIEIANGDFRYVNIVNVVNPNEFYCQLVNDNNELLGMTEQISQFYENLNDYDFILENVKIGNPCCILSKNNVWCRGKIIDIIEKNANVFYVDYGNSEIIPLKNIKILKPEFLKVTMQVLRCSCQGIQAKESLWNEDDIKLFKDMTQDKYFLAQFLNKEKENTYLVNLLTVDALKEAIISKEFLKSGHGIKQSQESPQLKLPYPISYQTEVPNPVINIGEKLEITVTWVFTIEKFYCQLTSFASQFEEIMISIQKKYSEMLELEAVIEKPDVDSYCIAQFSEDNAWYRAKIVYVDGNKVGVHYIDYGNEEEVARKKIKYILPQFALLPSQAIKCQMNDIKSSSDNCKISENLVQKYFFGNIICTFHSFIEDLYLVDLERDGENISQLLIKDKLASPKNDYIHPSFTDSSKLNFLKIDLSHRLDESMNILVSYAESPYNFWCQLMSENNQLEKISNSLAMNYNELSADSENLLQFAVNTLCVAKYSEDNEWYRAVVKTCYSDQLEVIFIDYGNSDMVPLSQIRVITSDLSSIPAQAIECSLYGIPSSVSEEKQKEFVDLINGNEMKMIINEYNMDGVSLVTLIQNCEEVEINIAEKLFGKLTSVTEIFTSHSKPNDIVKGYVTTINSISEFYLQLSCNEDSLSKLMIDLEEVYSSLSVEDLAIQTIIPNTACCAKFSEDNNWYRAVIKDIKGNEVTVYFIDYGNVDVVPRTDIKVLKEEFLSQPSFSFKCSLEGVKPINEIWSNEALDWFHTFIQDKTLDILFIDKSNSVIISTEEGDVSKFLIEKKFALKVSESLEDNFTNNKNDNTIEIIPNKNISSELIPKFILSGCVHVVLSHIETANIFYVTLVNRIDDLNSLQEELQKFYNNEYEDLKNIVLSQTCAAKFSLDEKWYRAEIIEIAEKSVTVRFVDYGNSEILSEDNLKILHPKFLEFPSFASECSFSDLVANPEKLDEAKLILENLLNDKEFYINVADNEKQLFYISITSDTEKLRDQLVESGLYLENIAKQDTINYSYIFIPLDCKTEVVITHALSPSEFWIQLYKNRSELDILMKNISEKYQEEEHQIMENFTIGKLCIASYSLDQCWYRAMITDVQNDNIELFYVDYGNKEIVSKYNIKEILPEFQNIPIQAVKCTLTPIYPDNKTLNEEICALFQEIVISDEKVFQAEFKNKQNDQYEVILFDNGIDIKDILIQKQTSSVSENDKHFIEVTENIESENACSNEISKNVEHHNLEDISQETQMLQRELSVFSEESIIDNSQQNKYEFVIEAMSTPLNKHKSEIKSIPEDISVVKTNDDLSYSHENDTTMYISAEDASDKIKSRILPLKQLIENEFGNAINLLSNEKQEKKTADIDLIHTFNDIASTELNRHSAVCDLIQTNDIENNPLLKTTDICYENNEKYESEMKELTEKYGNKSVDDGTSDLFYEVKANERSESETLASFESLENSESSKIIDGISEISCEMEADGDYEIQDSFISLERCDKYKIGNDRIIINDMDPISQFPSISNQKCIKEVNTDEIQMNQSKIEDCCSLNSYEERKNYCFQQTNIIDMSETQGYIPEQSKNKIEADIGICLSKIKLNDIKDSDDDKLANAKFSSDISCKLSSEILDFKNENGIETTECYDNFKLENICLNDNALTNFPDHKRNEESFDDNVCEQFQKSKFPVTNSKENLSEYFDTCLNNNSHSNRSELGQEYKETHGFCKSQEEKIVPGQISYVNLFDTDSFQSQNDNILKNSITAQDGDTTTLLYSSDPIKRVRRSSMEEKIVPGQLSYIDEKSKVPGE